METLDVGPVQLRFDGNQLVLTRKDQKDIVISLDSDGVEEFVDFITSLAGTESNRRATFRVPLDEESGLEARLSTEDVCYLVLPRNISLTGIFVELAPGDMFDLDDEAEVEIGLKFEGRESAHSALVKRRTEDGFGLLFHEVVKNGEPNPPADLSQVVMELQRRWMSSRAKRVGQLLREG